MLDAIDVECPLCEAKPAEPCTQWWYGREYPSTTHFARQEAADVLDIP